MEEDEKMVGYYDSKGHLIDSRPATPEEMGGNLFRQVRIVESEKPRQVVNS